MHPIAFQFGSISVTWFGVMMAIAFMVGLWDAGRRAPLAGVASDTLADAGPWLIVAGVFGARALYVATFWRQQFAGYAITEWFKIWHGGLVFYGGLVGASLAVIVWVRLKKLKIWVLADILAPSLSLGYAFGRIGCLLNGCCYGKECALPWAIHFSQGHPSFPKAVHPTEVYEALLAVGLYFVLRSVFGRRRFDGQVFAVYLFGYSVLRFSVEFLRGDYPAEQHFLGGWATPGQVASLLIFLTASGLWLALPRRLIASGSEGERPAKEPPDLAEKR